MVHTINLKNGGIWLVNNKKYSELNEDEKMFLNDYFAEQKVLEFKTEITESGEE